MQRHGTLISYSGIGKKQVCSWRQQTIGSRYWPILIQFWPSLSSFCYKSRWTTLPAL